MRVDNNTEVFQMNMSKKLVSSLCVSLFFFSSCGEVKEGADKISSEVTGERQIKTGQKLKGKIKSMSDKSNKKHQDALDSIGK